MYYEKGKEGMLMRRKLLAVVSIVALFAMESMTVFATETGTSPTASTVNTNNVSIDEESGTVTSADGATLISNAENTRMSYTATPTGAVGDSAITESTSLSNASISVVSKGNNGESKGTVVEKTLSNDDKVSLANKIDSLANEVKATNSSAQAVEYLCVNLEYDGDALQEGESVDVAFNVEGLTESRAKNIVILHLRSDGFWEKIPVRFENGKLIGTITGFSPFLIVEYDQPVVGITVDADYSAPAVASTVSGATSPKTAEPDTYKTVAAFVLIALAGTVICSRKIINK
jgi:hypothetical protein